ncbi:MAG: 1,4-alpha-glucan branching protein GlgB [Deltaproteobacteria bacterium]|nr:1,4-alpha-glucan branching protein GlgB [Deltaproteobacteria bacterium]
MGANPNVEPSTLGDLDLFLFNEGTHSRLYEHLGAHLRQRDGRSGAAFSVWAPEAERVSVIADFDGWREHPLRLRGASGIWERFVEGPAPGTRYRFRIRSRHGGTFEKTDPFGFRFDPPPSNAAIVHRHELSFDDEAWMSTRGRTSAHDAPISIYEVHLGSWIRPFGAPPSYREVAEPLARHVANHRFTHVELMPLMEHPFYGSWGYQTTGYFAPTGRYGTPEDLAYFVNVMHRNGIGVIFDWVPSHFPTDTFALARFDGTHLYEHQDPRQGHHPDWDSAIFNYGRNEVRAFLISSACFWLEKFHVDGLRVDAVASMLYLDYSRKHGEWIPNRYGGRENVEAIDFLRQLNGTVADRFPGTVMIAEESTAWPMVTRPAHVGGLGFHYKWDMGWMHDTLAYMSLDPIFRRHHHQRLTFRPMYAYSESFVLALSHDEVVHMKGSLYGKMPGDVWKRFANVRLLFANLFGTPGKKLLFMGMELADPKEWSHERGLDFGLYEDPAHAGIARWVRDLNGLYRALPALHELDHDPNGFEWVDFRDTDQSVFSYLRKSRDERFVLVVLNHTPVPRYGYRIGVPRPGKWREALSSDALEYGGSGVGNLGAVEAEPVPFHGHPFSLPLTLPPLGALFFVDPG